MRKSDKRRAGELRQAENLRQAIASGLAAQAKDRARQEARKAEADRRQASGKVRQEAQLAAEAIRRAAAAGGIADGAIELVPATHPVAAQHWSN